MKVCTKCKKKKEIEEFCLNAKTKDGRGYWCKECVNKQSKRYKTQPFANCIKQSHLSNRSTGGGAANVHRQRKAGPITHLSVQEYLNLKKD